VDFDQVLPPHTQNAPTGEMEGNELSEADLFAFTVSNVGTVCRFGFDGKWIAQFHNHRLRGQSETSRRPNADGYTIQTPLQSVSLLVFSLNTQPAKSVGYLLMHYVLLCLS